MAIITKEKTKQESKKSQKYNVCENVEKLELLHTAGENVK